MLQLTFIGNKTINFKQWKAGVLVCKYGVMVMYRNIDFLSHKPFDTGKIGVLSLRNPLVITKEMHTLLQEETQVADPRIVIV